MVKDSLGANERTDDMVGWRLEVIACWRDNMYKNISQSSKTMNQQHPKCDPDAEH